MPHYKAPDNSLHFLDDEAFAYVLPAGSVQITDDEAQALQPKPDPKDVIRNEIAVLEASITPRRLREALMTGDHTFITGVDAKIAALRSQL